MSAHSSDEQFLQRALELAKRGIGLASPNPYVGAVIVDAQGNIVGEATYTYAEKNTQRSWHSNKPANGLAQQPCISISNPTPIKAARLPVPMP
jgi:deoxycytidylate deaminase